MDDEGNAKKQKQSTSVGTAGNTSSASASASASGGECEVFLSFRGEDTRKGFTACIVEMFRLPCIVTAAVILLSLPVFSKLLKKRGKRTTTAVTTENTSSASNCASDSSSASASGGEYEVFLSFRGEDTRKGFTDFLYTYLVNAGIRAFRDNEELRVGEEIGPELLKAIRESKISIPIFSSDYASSKWCLLEVVQMVECRKTLGQKILPIFYDVKPSDVKHQTGSYEKAFCEHKKHFNEETVQGWKAALREVGELKGWELEKETDGHQGELAKMVVEQVLLDLKKNYMVVTENLVGIDHHKEKMMEFLNVDSNDVQIVGIHGMGGIGKTTIAKVIYNQLSERFECCCFLSDVRETSQTKGFVYLQNQLICKILKVKCFNIANDDEGINTIKDKVCRKKVLIVLDDVDEKSQFDKLAGKRDWYGSGSRIIVTTRNEEVLNRLEVDKTYEPPVMEPDHSLQLFCKHAFKRDSPLEDYDTLSREIVSTAAGLPLALEVIGSSLFLEGKEVWNDTLMKLKEIPDEKVQEKLRISYEALNYGQKQIFLDIACLFIGKNARYPSYMWDDCKFFPTTGIKVLVRRSLVKIGDYNTLRMHDQLRDLGREIVRKENFQEPGECSRLWRREEALDMLKSRMGTKTVVALSLGSLSKDHCFTNEEFAKLPNLRFLRLDNADLAGDFENLLSNLRWLSWHGRSENFTPTNFYLKNLVILDLSSSKFTDDWEGWSQIKMATKLKVLDLSYCSGLTRTPDLSTFETLEILILSSCKSVERLPDLSNLKNLSELRLSGCSKLMEIQGLGKLELLTSLDISFCGKLTKLDLSNLKNLSKLMLMCCSELMEIQGLGKLELLTSLDLSFCGKLTKLDGLPSKLFKLCLISCKSVERLPDLSNLKNLSALRLSDCSELMEIQGLGKLELLTSLDLFFCRKLTKLDGLPSSLFKLDLNNCKSVERLPDLSNLKNLSELRLHDCSELMEIQGLGKLELLTSLDVSECRKLTKLDGPEQLESLTYLNTSHCKSLERLPDLSNLKKLQKLITWSCKKLIEIQGLDKLESLEHLDMGCCISIERLPNLSNLGMLKELKLWGCQKLAEVEGIGVLESLERLDMSWCKSLERSLDLSKLKNLKELKIRGWENLTEIRGLEELESLELLDINGCKLIEKLPDLSNLKNLIGSLRVLDISGTHMTKLPDAIGNLEKLEEINASNCRYLQGEIPSNIGKLSSLRILRLDDTKICSLPTSICGLSCLQTLDLFNCEELQYLPELPPCITSLKVPSHIMETFPSLFNLMNLEELFFSQCLKLLEIPRDFGKLSKLKTFNLYNTKIRSLPPEIGALYQLKKLKVRGCNNLNCIPWLPSSLVKLCLNSCKSLDRLPDLSNLKKLSELNLVDCFELMEIQGLGKLELLTRLDVSLCGKLPKLDGLEQLESLNYLNTSNCESLERLPDLSNLKKLQNLITRFCEKLIEIQGLDKLESLKYLDMGRCISIERLSDLSNLGMLKELKLWGCQQLAEVEGLWVLESLEKLDVSWCISLERSLDLSKLKILKELKIRGWKNLTEIRGLEELESLELLDIAGCKLIETLPDLSNLKNLEELNVFQCEKLTEIQGLEELNP